MSGQNLLPKHRIEAWKFRRAISAWAMGLCVLSMLVGGLVLGAFMTQAQPQTMPVGLTEQLDLDKSELALVRAQVDALRQTKRAHEIAMATPQWDGLLAVLAREARGRVQLRTITVRPDATEPPSWSVSIAGTTSSKQAPAALANRLEATGLFASVRHGLSPLQAGMDETSFSIECVIAPEANDDQ